ncbi:MAG TPA: TetR/AcrR family transcriptional regulator, partial [Magnetospirillaceae bacterium]|nr:TetR/AcrR family transcriptional regulator [Magnetospirillaceae bacterium]
RLLLDEGGAGTVSMRKVADKVGVTAMAIYRHFPDREALLGELANQGFAEMARTTLALTAEGSLLERMDALSQNFVDFGLNHPHLFELMFLARRPGARQFPHDFEAGLSPTANLFADMLKQGVAEGLFRDGEDIWEITFETGALMQGLLMLYLGGRIDLDAEGFRALVRRSLRRYTHGIRA